MAFFKGVIEGFYGKSWTWQEREDYASFLNSHDFDGYIYAPKSNRQLRSDWSHSLCHEDSQALQSLTRLYLDSGLDIGIGFSPLNLFKDYNAESKQQLKTKLAELDSLGMTVFCLLFDDMPGGIADLAEKQAEIIADVKSWSSAERLIVCPTYYSFDPVLAQVFGDMPRCYLEDFGRLVDHDIDIFWTGDKVISDSYSEMSLMKITELLNRKPMIWDNYPVNDGRKTSRFLNLKPYKGRPAELIDWCAGHVINPMNQAALSKLVLKSFPMIFDQQDEYSVDRAWQDILLSIRNAELASVLARDIEIFAFGGLDNIPVASKQELVREYKGIDHPAANEIVLWLEEAYQFDPQCLTE